MHSEAAAVRGHVPAEHGAALAGVCEQVHAAVRRVEACPPLFSGVFMAGTADLLVEENRAGG